MKLNVTVAAAALAISALIAPALAGDGRISSGPGKSAGKEREVKISRALGRPKFANPESEKPTPKVTPLYTHDPQEKEEVSVIDDVGYTIKKPTKGRP